MYTLYTVKLSRKDTSWKVNLLIFFIQIMSQFMHFILIFWDSYFIILVFHFLIKYNQYSLFNNVLLHSCRYLLNYDYVQWFYIEFYFYYLYNFIILWQIHIQQVLHQLHMPFFLIIMLNSYKIIFIINWNRSSQLMVTCLYDICWVS